MLWTLYRSQLVCAARRAIDAFAVAPVMAGAVAMGFALLPAFALWAGARIGPLTVDPATAKALALTVGLGAALVGCSAALLAPARAALGSQLEVAPVSGTAVFLGVTALPFSTLATALAIPVVLFLLPVTGGNAPTALASLVSAFALAGAATEATIAVARRALRGLVIGTAVALLCLAGPLEGATAAAQGNASVRAFVLAPAAIALALVAGAMRPPEPHASARVRVRARGLFSAALVRHARRRELRRNLIAGLALSVGGTLLLHGAATPQGVAVVLGGATAVLSSAVVPLAASGIDREWGWLSRTAPRRQEHLALVASGAALGLGAAAASAGVALCRLVSPAPIERIAPLAPAAAVVFGAAVVGGALLPWRSARPIEQLATFSVFAALLTALSIVLARIAPLLGADGGGRAVGLAAVSLVVSTALATLVAGIRA